MTVASITVTLNPEISNINAQLAMLGDCQLRIIVDNCSDVNVRKKIESLCKNHPNTVFIPLTENVGIAKAQNIGASRALRESDHIGYLFFLDHDSIPEYNCVSNLIETLSTLDKGILVGAISPRLIDPRNNREYGFHKYSFPTLRKIYHSEETKHVECDYLNSSGTLIPLNAWKVIGEFDEGLFIDHVDTDWCFRAQYFNFRLFGAFETKMYHQIGDQNVNFWLFGKRSMPYRSPTRHFYIFRNSIRLYKRNYTPKWWISLNILKLLFTFFYFSLFSKDRRAHFKSMITGLSSGFKSENEKPQN